MAAKRDTSRYTLRDRSGRVLYRGITNDPERRAAEHDRNGQPGKMRIEGPKVTRESALRWERKHRR